MEEYNSETEPNITEFIGRLVTFNGLLVEKVQQLMAFVLDTVVKVTEAVMSILDAYTLRQAEIISLQHPVTAYEVYQLFASVNPPEYIRREFARRIYKLGYPAAKAWLLSYDWVNQSGYFPDYNGFRRITARLLKHF